MRHDLEKFIRERFRLQDEQLSSLRLLAKPGVYESNPVTLVRFFSARSIAGELPSSYDGLDRHVNTIWFQGYVTRGGEIHLADRRPMKAIHRRGGSVVIESADDMAPSVPKAQ